MKTIQTSLIILLALFASLTNNQAAAPAAPTLVGAQIPITYLPYTISAPGTYVLKTDLVAPPNGYGILITQPLGGTVLDLKGHTIYCSGDSSYGIIAKMNGGTGYVETVTIQNGTLSVSAYGLEVTNTTKNSSLVVQNMTFLNNSSNANDVQLWAANGALLKNCKFVGAGQTGILDANSLFGNSYTNMSFDGKLNVNISEEGSSPLMMNVIGNQYPLNITATYQK
jgi:hypothetical protein